MPSHAHATGTRPNPAGASRKPRRNRHVAALVVLLAVGVAVWSVQLVDEYRGVAQARDFWSSPHGKSGGLLYVALGDSTAQGVGASRPDRGYVGLLADRLQKQTGKPVQVINLSVSGARVQDVLDSQIPDLRELAPDVVTVAIGGNDVRSYKAPEFASQVDQLTAALPPGTFVADLPWFMHGQWQRDADQAAQVLRRSATRRGLNVVPLHQALRREGWTAMLTDFAPDWFHPNDRGYRIWAGVFWSTMKTAPVNSLLPSWNARGPAAPTNPRGRDDGT